MKDILRRFRGRRFPGLMGILRRYQGEGCGHPPTVPPLFGLMALLRSMCSKTCHAAEATSMVAAFPPGAQDVFASIVGKMFLLLSHEFH